MKMTIWRFSDDEWSEFEAADLAFDGTYASFLVTEPGKYAVTALPEKPSQGKPMFMKSKTLRPWFLTRP